MRTLEVDDEVWAELQKRAEPLVDTVNDVMREVLGLSSKATLHMLPPTRAATPRRRTGRIDRTQDIAFRLPILQALVDLGGRARRADVLDRVGEIMRTKLTRIDHELVGSGADTRWRNTASFERKHMIDAGLLSSSSPNGIWEITDAGREYLARSKREGKSA